MGKLRNVSFTCTSVVLFNPFVIIISIIIIIVDLYHHRYYHYHNREIIVLSGVFRIRNYVPPVPKYVYRPTSDLIKEYMPPNPPTQEMRRQWSVGTYSSIQTNCAHYLQYKL